MRECKKELEGMIDKTNSHPILIRLAWHDAGEPQIRIPYKVQHYHTG